MRKLDAHQIKLDLPPSNKRSAKKNNEEWYNHKVSLDATSYSIPYKGMSR
jgi:hypothetical protein